MGPLKSPRSRGWAYSHIEYVGSFQNSIDMKSPQIPSPSLKVITGMVRNNLMCDFNFTLSCCPMIPSNILMYMLIEIELKTEAQKEVVFFCEKN